MEEDEGEGVKSFGHAVIYIRNFKTSCESKKKNFSHGEEKKESGEEDVWGKTPRLKT